jgi:heat shock protein HslJ
MQRRTQNLIPALIVAALLVSGCASQGVESEGMIESDVPSNEDFQSAEEIINRSWVMQEMQFEDGTQATALIEAQVTLQLGFDGKVSGSAGCNDYFSGYELGPQGAIKLSAIGSTRKTCANEEINAQEQQFLAQLGRTVSYKIVDEELIFFSEFGETMIRFGTGSGSGSG